MKYKIEQALIHYENLQIRVNGKWYFMGLDKLEGLSVCGDIVKKRTRVWLE